MALTRCCSFALIGQSYAKNGYTSTAYYGCMTAIAAVIEASSAAIASNTGLTVNATDLVHFRNLAVGGSAILQANEGADGYWVTDALAAGSLLTTALSAIGGYSQTPLGIIYSHGQQDAIEIASDADADDVAEAIDTVLWPQLRSACNAGSPSSVPIWVDMIGPRFSGSEMGEYRLRDRIIDLIDNTSTFFGSETYHLPLDSTTHPNADYGYKWMGAATGRKIAAWLLDDSVLRGPSISSATIVGSTVEVDFTIPAGETMLKPTRPDFFGLFDASDVRVTISSYSWDGDTLVLGFTGTPTKLRYPARSDRTLEIENIIRLDNPSPLFTDEPGLVLESVKTIAL